MRDGTPQAASAASVRAVPVVPRPTSDRPTPDRPTPARPPARNRPDPGAMRLAGGFVGLATASAIVSAMLAPAPIDSAAATTAAALTAPGAVPEVVHVTHYVQLKPGETAPPQAVVQQQAAPAPRIVRVVTKQSGVKP